MDLFCRFSSFQYWHDIVQAYMDATFLFMKRGMYRQCVFLAEVAIQAMLKALIIKKVGILPYMILAPGELIKYTSDYYQMDYKTELLLHAVAYLDKYYDEMIVQPLQEKQLISLLKKVDALLHDFSSRVVVDTSHVSYFPVWREV